MAIELRITAGAKPNEHGGWLPVLYVNGHEIWSDYAWHERWTTEAGAAEDAEAKFSFVLDELLRNGFAAADHGHSF